jgi:hypothetical protein
MSGTDGKIQRYLRFSPAGAVKVRLRIRGDDIAAGSAWTGPQWRDYLSKTGIDAERDLLEPGPPVKFEITVHSLDKQEVHDFIRGLTSVPTGDGNA